MKLNTSKMIFLTIITLMSLMSMSINNWLTIWIIMEASLFMFIPLMSKNKINDQSMKYFIIQSTSSYILVFSILWNSLTEMSLNNMLTLISLMIKIGMPPFHIWKPEIMKKMTWNECMVLTTVIKIPPLVMLNKLTQLNLLIMPLSLALIVGSMSGINQLNLKKMMAYSSIFNISWMTPSFMMSKKTMMMFLIIYSILNIKIMDFFKKNNLVYLNQTSFLSMKKKISLNLNLLSISGLPPLAGFYPKWIILSELIKNTLILPTMMILTSIISIFMYIQINTFSFSNLIVKKKTDKNFFKKNFSILTIFTLPMMMIMWKF